MAVITPEPGELVGHLIAAGLLADTAETFASPLVVDWSTWEFASTRAAHIATYFSHELLPATHLRYFFSSKSIPKHLKDAAIANLTAYVGAGPVDIRAATTYAIASGSALDLTWIEYVRANGATETEVVRLLAASPTLPVADLRAVLRRLPYPYDVIADPGVQRPQVPDDHAHITVLNRLKAARVVSDHKPDKGERRVYLHQR